MDAVARHDVGLAVEYPGGGVFHVHQFEQAELALFIIEEQVNVGILARIIAGGRTEQVKDAARRAPSARPHAP